MLVGVPTGIWGLTLVGAALAMVASWHGWTIFRMLRRAPGSSGTIRYYIAAAISLILGASFGAAWPGVTTLAR